VKRIDKFVTIVARSAVEAHPIANKTLAVASRRVVNPINQNDFLRASAAAFDFFSARTTFNRSDCGKAAHLRTRAAMSISPSL